MVSGMPERTLTVEPRSENGAPSPLAAHVVPEYLPRSATFVYTTIRFEEAFRPLVLTKTTANLDEFPVDGPVLALSERGYERRLSDAVAEHRPVVVHAHFGWSGPPALPAARRAGIPLVTTFYGRDLALQKRRLALRHPYSALFREGALFTCEGTAMARQLASIGCPERRIRIVKIGIDLAKFPFEPRTPAEPLVLVQTARLVEKKGVDITVRAFAAARSRLGPAELLIVGDGPLRADLERLAESLGVSSSVRFLGELSHDGYIEATRRAHLCLQPSRTASDGDTEGGAPTVLLEMQAYGVGVVATRHADIPHVVADPDELAAEEDAEGVADALVGWARLSPDDWRTRLERARAFVEREHDARVTAGQHEQVYREALAGAGVATEAA
jgi:glycosyltransferase involved in cell wall biosynthesis